VSTKKTPAERRTDAVDEQGLGDNPLGGDDALDPLADAFYAPRADGAQARTAKRRRGSRERQPLQEGKSFRLVTFSFYEDDVARLDELLRLARARGHRKANRSQIVRLALRQVDLSKLPDEI